MSALCPKDSSTKVAKRNKKTRRGKRWRNEEERRRLINEYMKQQKHKVAPSNTTQFLIEDREEVEPILYLSPGVSSPEVERNGDFNGELSPNMSDEDHFNEQFFLKDFESTYRQMYRENLYDLPKCELLEKVKELESKKDELEREYRCCLQNENPHTTTSIKNNKQPQNVQNVEFDELQQQINSLREENSVLRNKANDFSSNTEAKIDAS